jgi:trimethylamine--corrinoid protein Co-methyltransferase
MVGGIDCSREAIGIDAFKEVGHSGQFLSCQHTLDFLRKERWEPRLTDRSSWDRWQSRTGGKDMRERAKDKVKEILETHKPVYIDEKKAKEIDRIASAAQKEISNINKMKS